MKNKRLIASMLALVMIFAVFAGCSKSSDVPANNPTPANTEKVDTPSTPAENPAPASDAAWDTSKEDEIIVTVINGYYTAGEKKLAEEYMKLHPETKVTIDVIADNNSYVTKMQTILSSTDGSNTPDIVHANFLGNDVVGSSAAAIEQGYLFDMTTILDMEHPYQDGIVRDMFDEVVLTEAINGSGGTALQALPFDKCGISFFYNKDAFAKLGLTAPETWEDLLAACAAFEEAGVENPITVSSEASWIMASLADAGFRGQEYDYLVQPGDALYDEASMPENANFAFDENNLACDAFVIQSDERIAAAKHNGSIFSDVSKTAWTEFAKLAKYFPENYIAGGADTVTEFEMQISPMLLSGSWNVGLILDDLNQMPEDARFDWATFNIPGFKNAPEGFGSEMRGLYVLGNVMGIVPKGDPDHHARVLDFYLYWYSQAGAQLCYEETLSNGNYVQGPAMIKGVTLSDALNEKLAGFVVEGPVKQFMSELTGIGQTTEADRPVHNDLINKLIAGQIDLDTFLDGMNDVAIAYVETQMENSGWDLDPAT